MENLMISEETVTQAWQYVSTLPENDAQKLINTFTDDQPYIMTYLVVISESEEFDEDEGQSFFFIGLVVWQIMRNTPGGLKKINEKNLDQVVTDSEKELDVMATDSPGDFFAVASAKAENYPEPEVLKYILEAIMEMDEDAEQPSFREENIGMAFMHLKIVLDALIIAKKVQ
jgi:hypothetical protein